MKLLRMIFGKWLKKEIRTNAIAYHNWVTALQQKGFPHNTKGGMMDCWQLYEFWEKDTGLKNVKNRYLKHAASNKKQQP